MSTLQTKPQLLPGMRLDCDEFLERWDALPNLKYAELINGVVRMTSPLSTFHSSPDNTISGWIAIYSWSTPGTNADSNPTAILNSKNVPQPDQVLRILPEFGGQAAIQNNGMMFGAPELAIEVSVTSLREDLGEMLKVYESAGVQEYIVVDVANKKIHWHHLVDGKYQLLQPEADGVHRSVVFPGLWLDAPAFFRKDTTQLQSVLQQGLQSPEHTEFIERLQQAKQE